VPQCRAYDVADGAALLQVRQIRFRVLDNGHHAYAAHTYSCAR
jgi:hypothetical protein